MDSVETSQTDYTSFGKLVLSSRVGDPASGEVV
jgi:hypothetical protein